MIRKLLFEHVIKLYSCKKNIILFKLPCTVLACFCLILVSQYCNAQQTRGNRSTANHIAVKGRVTDDKGEPLAGASIKLKGSEKGVVSDATGNFSLPVNKGDTVIVSFLGYNEYRFAATDNREMRIYLNTSLALNLNDVIVVAYGTQK